MVQLKMYMDINCNFSKMAKCCFVFLISHVQTAKAEIKVEFLRVAIQHCSMFIAALCT